MRANVCTYEKSMTCAFVVLLLLKSFYRHITSYRNGIGGHTMIYSMYLISCTVSILK